MKTTSKRPPTETAQIKIGVRRETRDKYHAYASRRRLNLVEVADIAIDALEALPKDQQDALIERQAPADPKLLRGSGASGKSGLVPTVQ